MVEQQRYAYILSKADDVVHLSEGYFNGCYFKRNDYMLSHSGSVIAYFDGKPKGGTAYTCRKAREKRMPVVYFNGCYFKRNDYMLSHSGSVIAYFDGKPKGGTAYTCRKAREKRMPVVNVY